MKWCSRRFLHYYPRHQATLKKNHSWIILNFHGSIHPLDSVQNKAISSPSLNLQDTLRVSLNRRRQITVFRKMQCSLLPHPLDSLKIHQLITAYNSTRQSSICCHQVDVILISWTSQHQRSFTASYMLGFGTLFTCLSVLWMLSSNQFFISNVHHYLINQFTSGILYFFRSPVQDYFQWKSGKNSSH